LASALAYRSLSPAMTTDTVFEPQLALKVIE
jgi:hypothetical protein